VGGELDRRFAICMNLQPSGSKLMSSRGVDRSWPKVHTDGLIFKTLMDQLANHEGLKARDWGRGREWSKLEKL